MDLIIVLRLPASRFSLDPCPAYSPGGAEADAGADAGACRPWYREISGEPLETERETALAMSSETLSPLLMDGANITSEKSFPFSVTDLTSNSDYLYLPYTITPESGAKYLSPDRTRFEFLSDSYSGVFYGGADLEVYRRVFEYNKLLEDSDAARDEKLYRQFVYDNYLTVPDVFRGGELVLDERYKNFVGETEGKDYDFDDRMSILSRKVYYIRNWLRENCAYDLSVGGVPENEDFVNRFLEETRAGSCSHFASAAVLLCRSAGIPARYVEGYVIKPKDFPADSEDGENASVDIADTRAHAWAEIYIDEFGWYPYEFTSGYGNIRTAVTAPAATETATVAPPPAPAISQTIPPATTESITYVTEREDVIIAVTSKKKSFNPAWLIILIIPAAIAAVPLRRKIILKNRAKREAKLSPTEAVFYAYYEIIPILERCGLSQSEIYTEFAAFIKKVAVCQYGEAAVIIITAVNTAFGGYEPTESDKAEILAAMRHTKTKFYNTLSKKRQFIEKYFRVFM
jgi:hypothetical protein